jgi:hypothetical protein
LILPQQSVEEALRKRKPARCKTREIEPQRARRYVLEDGTKLIEHHVARFRACQIG